MSHTSCTVKPTWTILLFALVGTIACLVPLHPSADRPSMVLPDAEVTLWTLTQLR